MLVSSLFPEVLCLGARGKAVAVLQLLLKGARVGPFHELVVDGDFGPTTQACVIAFEPQLFGKSVPNSLGLVYVMFFNRLAAISGAASLTTITSAHLMRDCTRYTGPGHEDRCKTWGISTKQRDLVFPKYFNEGSEGRAVTLLQVFLVGAGYGRNIVFDGQYGSTTAARVGDLQGSFGLDPDGNFGPKTRLAVLGKYGIDFDALPLFPFRTNTQWCEKPRGPLTYHPRRSPHDCFTSDLSHLTLPRSPDTY